MAYLPWWETVAELQFGALQGVEVIDFIVHLSISPPTAIGLENAGAAECTHVRESQEATNRPQIAPIAATSITTSVMSVVANFQTRNVGRPAMLNWWKICWSSLKIRENGRRLRDPTLNVTAKNIEMQRYGST